MTIRKTIFVNREGDYEESVGMFETGDFVNASTGAPDAGKPILLDGAGKLDPSLIDIADFDHGGLQGLGDDDHTQYILVNGTRAFTGDQSMGTNQLTNVGDPTASGINSASDDAIPMSFLASTTTNEGASRIGVEDSGGNFTSTDVEGVLAELAAATIGQGVTYTVGTGGVTKGDLVYVNANNTVVTYDDLSSNDFGIGIALATEAATSTVTVARNDIVATGIISSATAGDKYYWDGSGLTTTIPSGNGQYVWFAGVAKNATDLHIDVRYIKRNAL
jgi:hypothetical protein